MGDTLDWASDADIAPIRARTEEARVQRIKKELDEPLSGAIREAGLYEVADSFVWAILDGTFADATEEQVRHAVYELVAKSALSDG